MSRVHLSELAALEIADAARSYEETRPGLARQFLLALDRCFRNILQFPASAPVVDGDFRSAVIHQFPFIVVYRSRGKEVEVIALFPTQADPNRLLARLADTGRI